MLRRFRNMLAALCLTAALSTAAFASEFHGQVVFSGQPVPGVTVTATQGTKKVTAVTDQQGVFSFPDLADGAWHIDVAMTLFATQSQDVTVTPNLPFIKWELKLLPTDQVLAKAQVQKPDAAPAPSTTTVATTAPAGKKATGKPGDAAPVEAPKEEADKSSDALLINGSQNNAASSTFTTAPAFGNQRKGAKGLYNGSLGVTYENSAINARQYSFTGLDTAQPAYNRVTGVATFGGPIRIPHFIPRGPNFFIAYQWTRSNTASILPGIVPTDAQRALAATASDTVKRLLALYPTADPSLPATSRYNYQRTVLNGLHQDSMQTRLDKTIGNRNQVYGSFAFQNTRGDSSNLFAFRDSSAALGLNTNIAWVHRWHHGIVTNVGYKFSRLRALSTPFCANGLDPRCVSVAGAVQTTPYAGPPNLSFTNISSFSDGQYAFNRNRTGGITDSNTWNHGRHFVTFGGDFNRKEFNDLQQQDARGTFTFTGATDFANFLASNPDTTSINYGNADKYLRQSVYDLFVTDDWRIRPDLTLNIGVRWEYGSPITELKGRLANLDIAPGFTAAQPVLGSSPKGPLTGTNYPTSLMQPDKNSVQPRVGVSWRPIPGSSLVVRAGYGLYQDTSVYTATALALAQQPPLATHAFSLDRATCAQTLTSGFNCANSSTFAVDPNFRVGYAHSWQLSVQRDLPAALQLTATYLGIKGTRGVQEFLPNTNPIGATAPCPLCPSGFIYRTSNGNSTREAGTVQLRRRLRSGFTATVNYTYAKALDNDSQLGGQGPVTAGGTTTGSALSSSSSGVTIAQNWLDLRAERSLSSFDQRHVVTATVQYTSGQGLHGGSLMTGWSGRILKEWTILNTFNASTGTPETPVYLAVTPGTGITGTIRPNVTGAPINAAPAGFFVNPAAFSAPALGQWGNARRNSITGPNQFTWNAQLQRTFRLTKTYSLDARIEATNVLNHVVYSSYNTVFNSTQFGLPVSANAMRSLEANARVRF